MAKARMFVLLVVVAHWAVAISHLFLAANVLPAPNNQVSWVAIGFITLGHLVMSLALWKLGDLLAAIVTIVFFLGALTADFYEHFLHPSLNNIFMVLPGDWTAIFKISVFLLLALEILGCCLGIYLLIHRTTGGRTSSQHHLVNHGALS
jgi:hypothetical protein